MAATKPELNKYAKKTVAAKTPVALKAISKQTTAKPAASKKATQSQVLPRPPKKGKSMKQIFRGLVISASGTFINSGKAVTHEQLARHVTSHGAEYDSTVTNDTTHLICSIEDYKKKTTQDNLLAVKKALQLGNKCEIVNYDWIVDCLVGPGLKKRLLGAKSYTLRQALKRLNEGKKNIEEHKANFDDGVKYSKELCNNSEPLLCHICFGSLIADTIIDLNHVYYDSDAFEYKVVLTRINLDGKVKTEKYTLFLFESNAKPNVYMCGAKLSSPGRPITLYKDKCRPMTFYEAFGIFRKFFHDKTGVEWDMRLEETKNDEGFFVYAPPVLGRPIGFVSQGYIRPELREPEPEPEPEPETEVEVAATPYIRVGEDVVSDTESEDDDDEESEHNDGSTTTSTEASQPRYFTTGMGWDTADPIASSFQAMVPYPAWPCVE
ncbi:hypothetical protein LSUB1_G004371 [Lachnellula subtilissima]|uniref:BRCT domain-containing protein n=1 Tax=Lachnellula subtilissima TaxID=602034 RepID=A0A8H8UAM8_9HELO|nr:hypothetical protein LSUB1_G004371 [Lachnellula subtilissima]